MSDLDYRFELSNNQEEHAQDLARKTLFVNLLDPMNVMATEDYVGKLRKSGITAENITVGNPWKDDLKEMLCKTANWQRYIQDRSDAMIFVRTVEDIAKSKKEGKIGYIFGLQNLNMIDATSQNFMNDLGVLAMLYQIGLRIIGPVYQNRNLLGNGCGEAKDEGLSKLGVSAVEEMNRVGIVVDLSHAGMRTALDVIETSKYPVVFSHSGVAALMKNVRNVSDEVVKAMAEKGGVIGLVAKGNFLRNVRATLDDYLDSIDYIAKMVGVDSIGMGFDLYPLTPKEFDQDFKRHFPEVDAWYKYDTSLVGLEHPEKWPNVVRGLVARGYSDADIRKITGENALRVFKKIWK